MTKQYLKGKIFELFCRYIVEMNGYTIVPEDNTKIFYGPNHSTRAINIAGRGTTHQVDLPYDYIYQIPFLYPIRLLGEVKCFSDSYPVEIKHIRDFYGVFEDIKQNYFLSKSTVLPSDSFRKTEQALFISASGFTKGAQKFALAHNIKLLSFNNSDLVGSIKKESIYLADYLYSLYKTRQISKQILDFILDDLFRFGNNYFINNNIDYFDHYQLNTLYRNYKHEINRYKSYLLGTTSKGHLMLFISSSVFPVHIFDENQEAVCSIYYSSIYDEVDSTLKLVLRDQYRRYVYYSTIPSEILNEFQNEHYKTGNAIQSKYNYFSPITFIIDSKIYKIFFDEFELHDQETFYENEFISSP